MADGSGAVAGDGGAAGGDAGAAAAVVNAAGAQNGGVGTAAVESAAATAAASQWYSGLDQDSQGWLQNKQYFGPDLAKGDVGQGVLAMIKAHRGMESIMGKNRVAVPKDAADKEGWDAYYTAGGRPADPKGYELKAGDGGDQKIADRFTEIAHKHGLSKQQVQAMAPEWDAFAKETVAARQAVADQQYTANSQADLDGLKAEWGGQTDAKFAAAQRAKIAYGLAPETMNKIERAIGTKSFITLLSNIGANVSEDGGAGQGENGFAATTAVAARAKLNELRADKPWLAKYKAGGSEEVAEFRRLTKIIADAAA